MAALIAIMGGSTAHAACSAATDGFTVDWDQHFWSPGRTLGIIWAQAADSGRDADAISISLAGDTDQIVPGYPTVDASIYGDHGYPQDAFAISADFEDTEKSLYLRMTFSQLVEDLAFELLDVDALAPQDGVGGFRDGLKISGSGESGIVLPTLSTSPSSAIMIGSPLEEGWALGYNFEAENGTNDGTLYVSFSEPVASVSVEYTASIDPQTADPETQSVALYDLDYCISRLADVQTSKTQTLVAETPADCDQIPGVPDPDAEHIVPGACIEYRISASNVGEGTADTLSLTDRLNPNLIFVAASESGFQTSNPGYELSAPTAYQDCTGGACTVALTDGRLGSGDTGEIIIRAIVK